MQGLHLGEVAGACDDGEVRPLCPGDRHSTSVRGGVGDRHRQGPRQPEVLEDFTVVRVAVPDRLAGGPHALRVHVQDHILRRRLLRELAALTPEAILARSDEGLPKLWVIRPALIPSGPWGHVLTGDRLEGSLVPLAGLLARYPVALLERQEPSP